jgi:spoIIIJ-associated protein
MNDENRGAAAMEAVEIEGKSIDEAIEKACSTFQVPREKLNIEIISEGSSGFLGMGGKKALIRASLLQIDMEIDTATDKDRPGPMAVASTAALFTPPPTETMAVKPSLAALPTQHAPAAAADHEPAAKKAKRILEGLLTRMEVHSPVTVTESEEAIILNIEGDQSGLVIGKRGQNLDALQYIVNKATHRSANGNKMIIVDTEGYRRRREESLVALATRLGEKAKKTQKAVTIGHMNAHDRRVIHLAMQNDTTLTTKSRGEGEYRKILILPNRKGSPQTDA